MKVQDNFFPVSPEPVVRYNFFTSFKNHSPRADGNKAAHPECRSEARCIEGVHHERKSSFFCSGILAILFLWGSFAHATQIQTIYGTLDVHEPVLNELIESQAFRRLQLIHQYGINHYIHKTMVDYNRYGHSLGVFALLRMFGAPLKEQIAGLLHDVSHTVFSHVGDHVASHIKGVTADQNDEAYQDDMHSWYLSQTDIAPILQKYGYSVDDINHKMGNFPMLERELPDICADRLEYQLYGAYAEGWITVQEINQMVSSIHYDHDRWYFDDPVPARIFGLNSIRLCTEIFGSAWNMVSYENAAIALLRAVDLGIINMHDIHFATDDAMWQQLCKQQDQTITVAIGRVLRAKMIFKQASELNYDFKCRAKFRGIDPWVLTADGFKRLTQLDEAFADLFYKTEKSYQVINYYSYME